MGVWAVFGSARIPSDVLLGLAAAWLLGSLCFFFLAHRAALHLSSVQPAGEDLPGLLIAVGNLPAESQL
ncbi:MAG: hypothetical protein IPM39_13540 [Chloroflexi bacterium]|nr:hypothetical protein [Chloroflexota bacterium]